jgi:hypothetical protein
MDKNGMDPRDQPTPHFENEADFLAFEEENAEPLDEEEDELDDDARAP